MMIPLLIGAGVAAAAVAAAVLSDDSSSSSSSSSASEELSKEKARQELLEAAARNRKIREEKRATIRNLVAKEIDNSVIHLKNKMYDIIDIKGKFSNQIDFSASSNMYDVLIYKQRENLAGIEDEFRNWLSLPNLASQLNQLQAIYGVQLKPKAELKNGIEAIDDINNELKALNQSIKQLEQKDF